ncbi:MAG: hypothetical protein EAZ42_10670 [Verrucomicrobia bacterium]|nr:MAG: hypothetical protein EAZ42_10670 [Verrucomicrobiota bacterium]
MKMIRIFLLLVGFCSLLHGSPIRTEWFELDDLNQENYWFIAFEEAAFIRKDIGDWLPIDLYKTRAGQPFRWKIENAVRTKNECSIVIAFARQDGKILNQEFEWTDEGPDGNLAANVMVDSNGVYMTFEQHDQTTRRLWIRRTVSIEELRQKILISIAQLLWKWENLKHVDL